MDKLPDWTHGRTLSFLIQETAPAGPAGNGRTLVVIWDAFLGHVLPSLYFYLFSSQTFQTKDKQAVAGTLCIPTYAL